MSREVSVLVILGACGAVAIAAWLVPASMQIVAWPAGGVGRIGLFAPVADLKWALGMALACWLRSMRCGSG